MAAQAEGPAGTPSAQVVGNAFVEQYYHILHQSPESVYRFYQESSVLSRPGADGEMTSVTTMQGINEKILSLNYKEYLAEIKTADAQQSFGEGVTVLVTGCLTGRDNVRKNFVQSFFLAPQEKGFYVLNDVFRYVEEHELHDSSSRSVTVTNETAPSPPLAPDSVQPTNLPDHPGTANETSFEEDPNDGAEVCDPSDNDGSVVEDEVVAPPPPHPMQSENIAVTSVSSVVEGDVPKQSYASIVKVTKVTVAPSPPIAHTHNVRVTPNNEQQSHVSPKPAVVPEPVASTGDIAPEISHEHVDVEGHSIYVRNLPLNATPEQLEQVFKKFGPIKQGGIQVRSNKQQGFCYGFVEFENATSMTNALEASPITIGNRKAVIEEKRTTTRVSAAGSSSGGGGRGRYTGGRGGGNSAFRGGDSYRGGRSGGNYGVGGGRGGYGRNGPGGEYSARNRRGGGGGGMGSYQRVDQDGVGSGRGGGGAGHYQQK